MNKQYHITYDENFGQVIVTMTPEWQRELNEKLEAVRDEIDRITDLVLWSKIEDERLHKILQGCTDELMRRARAKRVE